MAERNISVKELAARFGVAPLTLTLIRQGSRKPSLRIALAIEEATDGAISPELWVDSEEPNDAVG